MDWHVHGIRVHLDGTNTTFVRANLHSSSEQAKRSPQQTTGLSSCILFAPNLCNCFCKKCLYCECDALIVFLFVCLF